MGKVYQSFDELIGATPLIELKQLEQAEELPAKILAKLEYFNPAGSVKDRVAKAITKRRWKTRRYRRRARSLLSYLRQYRNRTRIGRGKRATGPLSSCRKRCRWNAAV